MPTFFPVYLGGHGTGNGTSTYLLTYGDKNAEVSTDWVKKRVPRGIRYSGDGGTSRLTAGGKVFDIDTEGRLSINTEDPNHITFLGVKYKDGMTFVNTAMVDTNDSAAFHQIDNRAEDSSYSNLAY